MIHHADAALEAWFDASLPKVSVTFDEPDADNRSRSPRLHLQLSGVREQTAKRNTEENDIRDEAGRVVARQRAIRFFDVDYRCSVSGPHPAAHEVLGALLQLVVDHEVVPVEHLPEPLREIGEPVELTLAAPPSPSASLVLRLGVPVQPTPEREIAPPAVELHLDMLPAPGRTAPAADAAEDEAAPRAASDVLDERRWTTVRRRERITPGSTADAS